MFNVGDRAIFNSDFDANEAHLNGSVVKILKMTNFSDETNFEDDIMYLVEFDSGLTMDVDIWELKEMTS